jgi:hypothetical protein
MKRASAAAPKIPRISTGSRDAPQSTSGNPTNDRYTRFTTIPKDIVIKIMASGEKTVASAFFPASAKLKSKPPTAAMTIPSIATILV